MAHPNSEYSIGDVEINEDNEIIGSGRSAHYFHRKAESYGVNRTKVASTYNRMESMIEPEKVNYEHITDVRPGFPKDKELKEAAKSLSRDENIESSATKPLTGHILQKRTAKREMKH
jgi:hypothetical protein